jgi:S-formylglutathione hydrolase
MTLQKISEHRCFDGTMGFYAHPSAECRLPMKFAVYQPPQARTAKVPVLFYLAGLTCTEETFMIKGGAPRLAAALGLMLVAPDTSPRGAGVPGEDDDWDFGTGAGFYLDAMQPPWSAHYRMYSYVTHELPALVAAAFPADLDRQGIFGHSMGGHGALVAALRNPGRYRSVSAFAPVVAPMQVPWGQKAFRNYLGANAAGWRRWDATELVRERKLDIPILVDQGEADQFLKTQLRPELLEAACREAGQTLTLRRHAGYDHSYWFVGTFMEGHLRHHAEALRR